MNIKIYFQALFVLLFISGCTSAQKAEKTEPPQKFKRVFSWGVLKNEDTARKFSEIGVSDIRVFSPKQLELAIKYGMTPYCGTFTPCGKHDQIMSPEEEKHFAYINGLDLKKVSRKERKTIIDKRRIEMKCRYGGEPVSPDDVITSRRIPCFLSDKDYTLSKKRIDAICSRVKGVKGIYFDYLGYSNFKGCYCKDCLKAYKKYLSEKGYADTPKNKEAFYRDMMVKYYNDMIDYVKSKHPDFKVVVHVYPTFLPEPLYGNRTKADFCGQTVAWYFPWDDRKIARYTKFVIAKQDMYFKGAEGIPFVGLNRNPGSLWVKDAATLDKELRTILAAGGDTLMVCNGNDMLKPGIYEVFKKYCKK